MSLCVRIKEIDYIRYQRKGVFFFTYPTTMAGWSGTYSICYTSTVVIVFVCGFGLTLSYDCVTRCEHVVPTITRSQDDSACAVSMPDNPYKAGDHIAPCQLEIYTNCTNFCQVEVAFMKMELAECTRNVTNVTDTCDLIDSCEYVLVLERGVDPEGQVHTDVVAHFHGHQSSAVYVSRTNRVLLQFCYRSETFSARNIQLQFKSVELTTGPQINLGPPSVYALGCVVILLIAGICIIRFSKTVEHCLDPPPPLQQRQRQMPMPQDV